MNKRKKYISEVFCPVSSGIITALSFCHEKFAFMIFFALIPFLYSLLKDFKIRKIFIFSLTAYSSSFIWVINSISNFFDSLLLKILLSFLSVTGISVILSVFLTFPFYIFKLCDFSQNRTAIFFPFIYIFGEWLQGAFHPIAFPWLRLGNILSPFTVFIQGASVFGTLLISLFILYVNILTTLFFINFKKKRKYYFIMTESIIIAANALIGRQCINQEHTSTFNMRSAVIVQGNYPNKSKPMSRPDQVLEKYINLSDSVKSNADLILFPETSINSSIYETNEFKEKLYELCIRHNSVLMFGSQYNSDNKHYNACIAATPQKNLDAFYLKRILVPFGEFVPFKLNLKSFLSSSFSAGKECRLLNAKKDKIGCGICFESAFPNEIRESVKKGAEVLTVISNDSWLGDKIPLYQHHSHSIMRAVENNRYVLTSANTGISSIIDSKGNIISKSCLNTEYVIYGNYSVNNKITPYTKYGDIIIIPSCIIILYCCLSFLLKQGFRMKTNVTLECVTAQDKCISQVN